MSVAGEQNRAPLSTVQVSIKGKSRSVSSLALGEHRVVMRGRLVRVGKIFDAYWLEASTLPDLRSVVEYLRDVKGRPDLFTFTQRVPDTAPRFDYPMEWDNVAVIPISTHDHWLRNQISAATRRNVRASEKRGVIVRESPFDDAYVRGIMSVSNESPIRAGRRYWHYGKDFATVQAEHGTYRHRATYIGAYVGTEMIGYLKVVWDQRTAAIMQVVSKLGHRDLRPNNALLSEAVRVAAERGVDYLQYERFVYGQKSEDSLTRFKRDNGFVRMDVPSYYVPLTLRGRVAVKLGLHKRLRDKVPGWVVEPLVDLRGRVYSRLHASR